MSLVNAPKVQHGVTHRNTVLFGQHLRSSDYVGGERQPKL